MAKAKTTRMNGVKQLVMSAISDARELSEFSPALRLGAGSIMV